MTPFREPKVIRSSSREETASDQLWTCASSEDSLLTSAEVLRTKYTPHCHIRKIQMKVKMQAYKRQMRCENQENTKQFMLYRLSHFTNKEIHLSIFELRKRTLWHYHSCQFFLQIQPSYTEGQTSHTQICLQVISVSPAIEGQEL